MEEIKGNNVGFDLYASKKVIDTINQALIDHIEKHMVTNTKQSIAELLKEAENLEYEASCLTYDHQESLWDALISKASILREIAKDKLSEITNGKVILVDGESGSEEAIKTILMNKETHTPVIIVERQKPIPIMKAPPIPIFEFESGLTKSQRLAIIKPVRDSKTNPKIGNNTPCSCGSGKKYKVCCKNKKS